VKADQYLLVSTGNCSNSPDIVYCKSMGDTIMQKLAEWVGTDMSLRQKHYCFQGWHRATYLSLQNRIVFAPPPGKYCGPKNFYAVLCHVGTKVKSRQRKKKRRQARNRLLTNSQRLIDEAIQLFVHSFVHSWKLRHAFVGSHRANHTSKRV
jgi:hypothetical protein